MAIGGASGLTDEELLAEIMRRRGQSQQAQPAQPAQPGLPVGSLVNAASGGGAGYGVGSLTGGGEALGSAVSGAGSTTGVATSAVGPGVTAMGDGTLVLAEGASMPAGYTGVGTAANGGTLIAPASQGLLGGVGPLGVAAGAYTGYQQATGLKDFVEGDKLDWQQKGALALPTFGASLFSDQIQKTLGIGGGKSGAQQNRDSIRKSLVKGGLAQQGQGTSDIFVKLADGSDWSIGKDGHTKFTGFDGTTKVRQGFEVDQSNPIWGQVAGALNPFWKIVTGGDKKAEQGITWFVNGAMSNAGGDIGKAMENVRKFYNDAGITYEQGVKTIDGLISSGNITAEEGLAYKGGLATVFGQPQPEGLGNQQPITANTPTQERPAQGPGMLVNGEAGQVTPQLSPEAAQPKQQIPPGTLASNRSRPIGGTDLILNRLLSGGGANEFSGQEFKAANQGIEPGMLLRNMFT